MNKLLFTVLLVLPLLSFAQDCDCQSDFQWMKKTFEENDAGFRYVLTQKGDEFYQQHNEAFLKKVKETTTKIECYQVMRDWKTFFRKGHFEIRPLNLENSQANTSHDNWETLNISLEKFKEQLINKKNTDYEGIWKSGPYTIGIKKIKDEYKGFIIEADGRQWKIEEVKLIINADNSTTYYMGDYSSENFKKAEMLGDKYLQLGYITLERVFPKSKSNATIERYYKAISAETPYLEKINDNTLLLRIPSFDSSQKKDIDSVLLANQNLITNTKNLIIDLRDNGGGSDKSFEKILPILYTNPIETVGVELFSTPSNNQRVKNFISHPQASKELKDWARKAYEKLSNNLGNYVNLDSTRVSITKFDTIQQFPKKIGIITNGQNASTTEQFLLAARQSTKVKLFGQTTFGALDISYTYPAESPCGDFELWYCLSKSLRIPEMTIDGKGVHPDYYIYNNIPKYKWIDFVVQNLN